MSWKIPAIGAGIGFSGGFPLGLILCLCLEHFDDHPPTPVESMFIIGFSVALMTVDGAVSAMLISLAMDYSRRPVPAGLRAWIVRAWVLGFFRPPGRAMGLIECIGQGIATGCTVGAVEGALVILIPALLSGDLRYPVVWFFVLGSGIVFGIMGGILGIPLAYVLYRNVTIDSAGQE